MATTITLTKGCLIGSEWKPRGSVLQNHPKARAERLIGQEAAVAGVVQFDDEEADTPNQTKPNTPPQEPAAGTFEDSEFPGAEVFAAAGILTKDAAAEFIKQHGDGWNNHDSMDGIGKKTAAKVAEALGL